MTATAKSIVISFVIAAILSLPATLMADQARGGRTNEALTVPFVNGDVGVQTVNSYSSRVLVKVRERFVYNRQQRGV